MVSHVSAIFEKLPWFFCFAANIASTNLSGFFLIWGTYSFCHHSLVLILIQGSCFITAVHVVITNKHVGHSLLTCLLGLCYLDYCISAVGLDTHHQRRREWVVFRNRRPNCGKSRMHAWAPFSDCTKLTSCTENPRACLLLLVGSTCMLCSLSRGTNLEGELDFDVWDFRLWTVLIKLILSLTTVAAPLH